MLCLYLPLPMEALLTPQLQGSRKLSLLPVVMPMTHAEVTAETLASEITRATIVTSSIQTRLMTVTAPLEMGAGKRMGGVITGETANKVRPPLPITASIRISTEKFIDGIILPMTDLKINGAMTMQLMLIETDGTIVETVVGLTQ